MNIFNKVLVILILLFFLVVSFVSIFNEFTGFFKWSDISSKVFNPGVNIPWYISTLALLLVIAVCAVLLLLEFYRKKAKIAKIYNVASGKAMITIDTIAQQIKDSILQISGVKNLKIEITSKSGGVIVNMLAELNQNLNIPEKMTEIIKTAKDVSTAKLNIKVLDTRLTITNIIPEEAPHEHEKNVIEKMTSENKSLKNKIEITKQAIYTEDDKDTVTDLKK